jgi:hypothetical protein
MLRADGRIEAGRIVVRREGLRGVMCRRVYSVSGSGLDIILGHDLVIVMVFVAGCDVVRNCHLDLGKILEVLG